MSVKPPPEGVRVQITNEADLLGNGGIVGIVQGPAGTPYEAMKHIPCLNSHFGGVFGKSPSPNANRILK
jgi:hypothetical protein